MDCIWLNLKNVNPPFFKFISVYIKMSFTQLENHSQTRFTLEEIGGLVLPFIHKWTNPK